MVLLFERLMVYTSGKKINVATVRREKGNSGANFTNDNAYRSPS